MRKDFAMVMMAAAFVSTAALTFSIGYASAAVATPVPTSATLKATCLSDGSMKIDSDALAPR